MINIYKNYMSIINNLEVKKFIMYIILFQNILGQHEKLFGLKIQKFIEIPLI